MPEYTKRRSVIVSSCFFLVMVAAAFWLRMCNRPSGTNLEVFAQTIPAHYGHDGKYKIPDSAVTPGAVDIKMVADLSGRPHVISGIEINLCAKDFRTKPIRAGIKDFPKLKREACEAYGISPCDASVEGDHLISLEIGGCPDCESNIWPQPMKEARIKDHNVEDVLPKLVCSGKISLHDAQQCIAKDWVACMGRIAKPQ